MNTVAFVLGYYIRALELPVLLCGRRSARGGHRGAPVTPGFAFSTRCRGVNAALTKAMDTLEPARISVVTRLRINGATRETSRAFLHIVLASAFIASLSTVETKASLPVGVLHVRLQGCTDTSLPSTLHIRTMTDGARDFRAIAMDVTNGRVGTTAELPAGYYSLNTTGGCATPADNEPVVVLSGHPRSIVLNEGTGIGMLYTGAVGLAGSLAAPAVTVYLDRSAQPSQVAIVDHGAYYFDYVVESAATYTLRVVDANGRTLHRRAVDLNGQRISSVRLLNL